MRATRSTVRSAELILVHPRSPSRAPLLIHPPFSAMDTFGHLLVGFFALVMSSLDGARVRGGGARRMRSSSATRAQGRQRGRALSRGLLSHVCLAHSPLVARRTLTRAFLPSVRTMSSDSKKPITAYDARPTISRWNNHKSTKHLTYHRPPPTQPRRTNPSRGSTPR